MPPKKRSRPTAPAIGRIRLPHDADGALPREGAAALEELSTGERRGPRGTGGIACNTTLDIGWTRRNTAHSQRRARSFAMRAAFRSAGVEKAGLSGQSLNSARRRCPRGLAGRQGGFKVRRVVRRSGALAPRRRRRARVGVVWTRRVRVTVTVRSSASSRARVSDQRLEISIDRETALLSLSRPRPPCVHQPHVRLLIQRAARAASAGLTRRARLRHSRHRPRRHRHPLRCFSASPRCSPSASCCGTACLTAAGGSRQTRAQRRRARPRSRSLPCTRPRRL